MLASYSLSSAPPSDYAKASRVVREFLIYPEVYSDILSRFSAVVIGFGVPSFLGSVSHGSNPVSCDGLPVVLGSDPSLL